MKKIMAEMRRLRKDGMTYEDIGKQFEVTRWRVKEILRNDLTDKMIDAGIDACILNRGEFADSEEFVKAIYKAMQSART